MFTEFERSSLLHQSLIYAAERVLILATAIKNFGILKWRHDIHHNDGQHNNAWRNTQNNDTRCWLSFMMGTYLLLLCWVSYFHVFMQNVVMQSVDW